MKVELRLPNIDKNAPLEVQTSQIRAFLFALVEQLQMVISNLPEETPKGENNE